MEKPTVFDTPGTGSSPAVATNGTTSLAVWSVKGDVRWSRIDTDGAPLDVPAQVAGKLAKSVSAVWNGTRFLALWSTATSIRVVGIDPDGTSSKPIDLPAPGASSVAAASNGTVTLVVFNNSAGGLSALRLGPDGSALEPSPLPLASGKDWDPQVVWNGSDFVAAWVQSAGGTDSDTWAARVTPDGQVLDPQGVDLMPSETLSLLGGDNGVLATWNKSNTCSDMYVARLTPALVVDTPVLAYSGYGYACGADAGVDPPLLSRSADGDLALVWSEWWAPQLSTTYETTYALALDANFAPVGKRTAVSTDYASGAVIGVSGAHHVLLEDSPVNSRTLTNTALGITAGGTHLLGWLPHEQSSPAIAGSPDSYLVAWNEKDADGSWVARARELDLHGNPTGDVVELGPLEDGKINTDPPGVAPSVAWSGSRFIVAWMDYDTARFFLSSLAPGSTHADTQAAPAAVMTSGPAPVACDGRDCLLVWVDSQANQPDRVMGLRLDSSGKPFGGTPLELGTGGGALSALQIGQAVDVFWSSGAVRVERNGHVTDLTPLPGIAAYDNPSGVPIAASSDSVLSALHAADADPNLVDIIGFDGTSHSIDSLGFGSHPSATWDGSTYLLSWDRNRVFSIDRSGTVQQPMYAAEMASGTAMASARAGYTLRVGSVESSDGPQRIVSQSLIRPDADQCY